MRNDKYPQGITMENESWDLTHKTSVDMNAMQTIHVHLSKGGSKGWGVGRYYLSSRALSLFIEFLPKQLYQNNKLFWSQSVANLSIFAIISTLVIRFHLELSEESTGRIL